MRLVKTELCGTEAACRIVRNLGTNPETPVSLRPRYPRRQLAVANGFLSISPVFLILLLTLPALASTQIPISKEFPYRLRHFTTEIGLPQNTVNAILQSRDGYIWIGTWGGLARYDGMRFRVFGSDLLSPDSNGAAVQQIFEDSQGGMWIRVNDDKLIQWSNSQPRYYSMKKLLPPGDALSIVISRSRGGLWAGSRTGLRVFEEGKFVQEFAAKERCRLPDVGHAVEDSQGKLWLRSVHDHPTPIWTYFDPDAGLASSVAEFGPFLKGVQPRDIKCGTDGAVWFVLADDLFCWKEGQVRHCVGPRPKGENDFKALEILGHHELWLRCRGGSAAVRFRDGEWFEFNRANGLAFPDLRKCIMDREGGIWIGTGRAGVQILQPKRVNTQLLSDPPHNEETFSVTVSRDGGVVVGGGLGVHQFHNGSWRDVANTEINSVGPTRTGIQTALYLRDGRLVVGVHDTGLQELSGDKLVRIRAADLQLNEVWHPHALFEDSRGRLWIGSARGLMVDRGERFELITTKDVLFRYFTGNVVEAPDGSLWIGSDDEGVTRMTRERFEIIDRNHGLRGKRANPLLAEPDGSIWISSEAGLSRSNSHFSFFREDEASRKRRVVGGREKGWNCLRVDHLIVTQL